MKRGINLKLPKKRASEVGKKFLFSSVVIFGITIIIGISIVGYNLYLESKRSGLESERENLLAQILQQNTKLYKLNDTHTRLSNIQSIINGRSKVIEKVDMVAGIISPDSEIDSIETSGLSINYVISSPNLGELNDLLEDAVVALALEKDKQVQRVELKSLTLNSEDKLYELNFNVIF